MLISLKTAETIVALITFIFAYIVSATTSGFVQAWVAHKMGDDTPARVGYYSWDPFVHVDLIGALFFIYAGIGWVRFIPINPININSTFKRACVYLSRSFTYFIVALVSLVVLSKVCGIEIAATAIAMAHSGFLSLNTLSACVSEGQSWALAFTLLLVVLTYMSVILGVLSFIMDGFRFVTSTFFPENDLLKEGELMSILIPLILIMLCTYSMRVIMMQSITSLGFIISSWLGAC